MKTRNSNAYGWESPEIIHKYSVVWHSRLNFILKELEFLKNLLKNNVFPIVESHLAKTAEDHLQELANLQVEVSKLLKTISLHKNGVKILFIKQAPSDKEWNYKHEHRKLMIKMHEFDSDYQMIKKEIFKVIKAALRHQKQRLIA